MEPRNSRFQKGATRDIAQQLHGGHVPHCCILKRRARDGCRQCSNKENGTYPNTQQFTGNDSDHKGTYVEFYDWRNLGVLLDVPINTCTFVARRAERESRRAL